MARSPKDKFMASLHKEKKEDRAKITSDPVLSFLMVIAMMNSKSPYSSKDCNYFISDSEYCFTRDNTARAHASPLHVTSNLYAPVFLHTN